MDANNEKELSTNYVEEDEPMKKNNKKLAKAARSAVAVGFAVGGITAVESFDAYAADGVDDGVGEEETIDTEDDGSSEPKDEVSEPKDEASEPVENGGDTEGGKEADGDTDGTGSETGAGTDAGGPSDETDAASGETQDQVGTQTEQQAETPDAQSSHDAGQEQQGPVAPEGYHEVSKEHAGEPGTIGKYYKSEESTDGNVKPANQEITEQEFKELKDQADANGQVQTGTEYYADHDGVEVSADENDYNAGTKVVGTDYYKYSEDNPDHHETIGSGVYNAAIANGGVIESESKYFKQEGESEPTQIQRKEYQDLSEQADQNGDIYSYSYSEKDGDSKKLSKEEFAKIPDSDKQVVDGVTYINTHEVDYFIDGVEVKPEVYAGKLEEIKALGGTEGTTFHYEAKYGFTVKDPDGTTHTEWLTEQEVADRHLTITTEGDHGTASKTTYTVNGQPTTDVKEYNQAKAEIISYVGEENYQEGAKYYCYKVGDDKRYLTEEDAIKQGLVDQTTHKALIKVGDIYEVIGKKDASTDLKRAYEDTKQELQDLGVKDVQDNTDYYIVTENGFQKVLTLTELQNAGYTLDNPKVISVTKYTVDGNQNATVDQYHEEKQKIVAGLCNEGKTVTEENVEAGTYYYYMDDQNKPHAILASSVDQANVTELGNNQVQIKDGQVLNRTDITYAQLENALKEQGESVENKTYYYKKNTDGSITLIDESQVKDEKSYKSTDGTTTSTTPADYERVKEEIKAALGTEPAENTIYYIYNDGKSAITAEEAQTKGIEFKEGKIYYVNNDSSSEAVSAAKDILDEALGKDNYSENTVYYVYQDENKTWHALTAGQSDDYISVDAKGNVTEKAQYDESNKANKETIQGLLNKQGKQETVEDNLTYLIYKDKDGNEQVVSVNDADYKKIQDLRDGDTLYYVDGQLVNKQTYEIAKATKTSKTYTAFKKENGQWFYHDEGTNQDVEITDTSKMTTTGVTESGYYVTIKGEDGKQEQYKVENEDPIVLSHDKDGWYFLERGTGKAKNPTKLYIVGEPEDYQREITPQDFSSNNGHEGEYAPLVKDFLDAVAITSNFDLYANEVNEESHIDGNVATNYLHNGVGDANAVNVIKAAAATDDEFGVPRYSVFLNPEDENHATLINSIENQGVVVGTNFKYGDGSGNDIHNGGTIYAGQPDGGGHYVNVLKDDEGTNTYENAKNEIVDQVVKLTGANRDRVTKELNISENLNTIATKGQSFIDTVSSYTKDGDFVKTLNKIKETELKNGDVSVINLTVNDYENSTNGFNALQTYLTKNKDATGARIIINVTGLDSKKEIGAGAQTLNLGAYSGITGSVFWNFGSYTGTINSMPNGVVVAPKAHIVKPNVHDGGVIADTLWQTSEIHKSRIPSTPDSTDKVVKPIYSEEKGYQIVITKSETVDKKTGRIERTLTVTPWYVDPSTKRITHTDTTAKSISSEDVNQVTVSDKTITADKTSFSTANIERRYVNKTDDKREFDLKWVDKTTTTEDIQIRDSVTLTKQEHMARVTENKLHIGKNEMKVGYQDIRKPVFKRTKFITLADYYFQPDKPDTPDTPDTPHEDHDTPDTPGDHDDHDTPDTPSNDEGKVLGVRRDKPDEGKVLGATREKPEVLGVNRHVQTSDSGEMAKNGLFASIGAFVLAVWAKLNKKSKKV